MKFIMLSVEHNPLQWAPDMFEVRKMTGGKRIARKLWVAVAGCVLLAGCSTSPTGRSQLMLVSPEQAITASKQAYTSTINPLDAEGKVDADPAEVKRVRRITGRIVAQAIKLYPHTSDWDWNVKVIDDPENVNAWCMAGGKMAVYTGLIDKVKPTDDELAQVMGHEVAHALANHTAERMSMAMATQAGLMGLAIGMGSSKYGDVTLTGAALAASVAVSLPNSRTAESEADQIGMELAARAGYDPRSAATLWQKMEQVSGGGPLEWLSTHPAPGNRQQHLGELAPRMMQYYLDKTPRPAYTF